MRTDANTFKLAETYSNATASTPIVVDIPTQATGAGNASDVFGKIDKHTDLNHGRIYYVIASGTNDFQL